MNMMNIIDNSSYYYGMLNDVKKLLQSAKENNKKNGWDIMDYDINEDAGEIVEEWSAKWDYTEVKNIVNERFKRHKIACKNNKNSSFSKYIINNDWTDWYVVLYENYPCNNRKELCKREGEIIRQIGTLNKHIAGRNNTEYRNDNADKRNEDAKQYYKDNIDKIKEYRKEKVCCNICGAFSTKCHLARHQKTKSCMSKIPNNIGIPSDTHN